MAYSSIVKPSDYFNTKLYTGNGSTQSITGVGFTQDFTWIKIRSETNHHRLLDTVRGATKELYSDLTSAEVTGANGLTSFNSDGFTLGTDHGFNKSSATYASWNWKANGTGSTNTDGTINSTVSANTTAGFSIVKYVSGNASNFTIGHGLGVAPKIVIAKSLTSTGGWGVYYNLFGVNTNYLSLNTTDVQGSNSADPDANGIANGGNGYTGVFATLNSTTISISAQAFANYGTNAIAYCFAEKKGYSKFGSYTGNGNADGTFVYTGFKPAFTIIKRTDSATNWIVHDNKRNLFNVVNIALAPNLSNPESDFSTSLNQIDFLSNGFKLKDNSTDQNASGGTYIYMAFAEEPLVANSGNGVPATAR